jgi:hydroxymethylglutaryl-CoA lyase
MKTAERAWITECPRDAMQGLHTFIPTQSKINYLNKLLQVGFERLDFGSFVSPKAIPQMRDTEEVLEQLKFTEHTKLLAIIANIKGAERASHFNQISILGFPFSISETFQQKNTNSSISDSFTAVKQILEITSLSGQELLIYISMAFGNPYNDAWNTEIAINWIAELYKIGVKKIALADTVGVSTEEIVYQLTSEVINSFPAMEIGAHLHCHPGNWRTKTDAAFKAGCRRFDTAIKGFGGCPMASDELVGNLATENIIQYMSEKNVQTGINGNKFNESLVEASAIFPF